MELKPEHKKKYGSLRKRLTTLHNKLSEIRGRSANQTETLRLNFYSTYEREFMDLFENINDLLWTEKYLLEFSYRPEIEKDTVEFGD